MSTDPFIPSDDAPARSRDRPSAWLGFVTLALVAATAWLRLGPGLWPAPPKVGSPLPPTRLGRLQNDEDLLLLGLEGRVTWLVFLSAESAEGLAVLPRLEAAWKRLKSSRRFAMVAAAVERDGPDRLRTALAAYQGANRLPLYRAGRDARRAFGVDGGEAPWHFLVDPDGRIAAIARGSGPETIDRLAKQASGWLEAMAPLEPPRFAAPGARNDVVRVAARR